VGGFASPNLRVERANAACHNLHQDLASLGLWAGKLYLNKIATLMLYNPHPMIH
jgi:hypothetical protein